MKNEHSTQRIAKSIQEWESGSCKASLVSCKERFLETPDHSEFISEIDKGNPVIRCSGWRTPYHLKFKSPLPFLVFDIAATFRDQLKSLDEIPLEISVYNEKYVLCGISSYVASRCHYVGYIRFGDEFLFYDGLPSNKPVLRTHTETMISGDVSLLCYFHIDSSSHITKIDKCVPHPPLQSHDEKEDAFLAQALNTIEKEEEKENIYTKPVGKSCRSRKRNVNAKQGKKRPQNSGEAQRLSTRHMTVSIR